LNGASEWNENSKVKASKIALNSYVTQILFVLRMRLIHYSKRSKFNRKLMMITGKKEIDGGIKF